MATRKDDRDTPETGADGGSESVAQAGRDTTESRARRGGAAESAMEAGMGTTRAVGDGGRHIADRAISQATDIGRQSTDQMRTLMNAGARAYRDASDYSREDVDALMQSGARLAKGMQDMSWEMMQFTQNTLRMGMKCANELMTCRTVEDMVNVQRNFVRDSVDQLLQESARLLEMSSSMASDAVNPINQRVGDSRH